MDRLRFWDTAEWKMMRGDRSLITHRHRVLFWVTPLVILGLVLIAIVADMGPGHSGLGYLAIGFLFGSIFGHATLASGWTALGPAPLLIRLPLSLIWVATIIGAMFIGMSNDGQPLEVTVVISCGLVAQWLLVQLPLWGLVMFYGLRVRHKDELSQAFDPKERQFGIRQLLIFTTIVAIILGVGRSLITPVSKNFHIQGEALIFMFLAAAAILMTLPVLLAALLPRRSGLAIFGILVLIGLATLGEVSLLRIFDKGSGPDVWHFVWINAFASLWIVGICLVLQLNGYSLRSRWRISSRKAG